MSRIASKAPPSDFKAFFKHPARGRTAPAEYQQVVVTCSCGCEHRGQFPFGVALHVSYWPRLKAHAVGRVDGHFVALKRTAEIIADQTAVFRGSHRRPSLADTDPGDSGGG